MVFSLFSTKAARSCKAASAAVTLVSRRLVGGFARPIDAGVLFAAAVMLAVIAAAVRAGWQWCIGSSASAIERCLVIVAPACILAMFAASLLMPGSPVWATVGFLTLLIVEEAASIFKMVRTAASPNRPEAPTRRQRQAPTCAPSTAIGDTPDLTRNIRFDPPHEASPHLVPDNVSQQLTRAVDEEGSDVLFGLLRGLFTPRQRTTRLHIAFCPPFDSIPEITADQVDGPEVRIDVGQVLPYGARVDLRITRGSDEPQEVVLEFHAKVKA